MSEIDALVRTERHRLMARWAVAAFVAAGVGLMALTQTYSRTRHFLWPAIEVVVGLLATGAMLIVYERHHHDRSVQPPRWPGFSVWVGATLLGCETIFLVTAGPPLWSATPTTYSDAPSTLLCSGAAGSSVVGFGASLCFPYALGIVPDLNVVYGVHGLSVYDPMTPLAYFQSWKTTTGSPALNPKTKNPRLSVPRGDVGCSGPSLRGRHSHRVRADARPERWRI